MNGLVLELQKDALNPDVETSNLLRKALVVAKKLNIEDFQKWVLNELNGYKNADVVPAYRIVRGSIKAWNPYQGWIPFIIENEKLGEALSTRVIKQSICELSSLVKNKKANDLLMIEYPQKIQHFFRDALLQPTLHIGANSIHGVIEHVRNTVLEWSLRLEKEGIIGENMSFSQEEKVKAHNNSNINIENFQGILGNVTQSTVTLNLEMEIIENDLESLAKFLKNNGIDEADIEELKAAIKIDIVPEEGEKYGAKVSAWIGKMVGKAASGVWQISIATAGDILATAISTYYGL